MQKSQPQDIHQQKPKTQKKQQLSNIIELTEEDQTKIQYTKQQRQSKDTCESSVDENIPSTDNKKKSTFLQNLKSCLSCLNYLHLFGRNKKNIKSMSHKQFIKQVKSLKYKPTQYVLPPQIGPERKTLVLDLDQTLIHSSFNSDEYDLKFKFKSNGKNVEIFTLKRFGIDYFLNQMSKYYQIVIFTAGLKEYAETVIDLIDPKKKISHRIYRQHCTFLNKVYIKNLNILNRKLKNIILIDNNQNAGLLQPDNLLLVQSFYNNKKDRQLIRLIPFLKHMVNFDDVRSIQRKKYLFNQKQIVIKQSKLYDENILNSSNNNNNFQNNQLNNRKRKQQQYYHNKRPSDLEQLVKRQDDGAQSDTKLTHFR